MHPPFRIVHVEVPSPSQRKESAMKNRKHSRKSRRHAEPLGYASLEGRQLLAAVSLAQVCLQSDPVEMVSFETEENESSSIVNKGEETPTRNIQNNLEVTEVSVGDGTTNRSTVDRLTLSFNGIADPQQDALQIVQRESGETVDLDWTIDNSAGHSVLTMTFSGTLTESGGSLEDGNYVLNVDGSQLGGELPGSDFVFGDQESDGFYRYFADADGNRIVNVFELLDFRKTYGSTMDDVDFDERFDNNGDGSINIFDLLKLRKNYGTSLPWT
jgi:methionine-rich copper-binding protein CopC